MTRRTSHSLLSEAMDAENVWRQRQDEQRHILLRRIRRERQIRLFLALGITLLLVLLCWLGLSNKLQRLLAIPAA
ncbi:MAG: hypothetical protein ACUVWX_04680 [Kiritimatiellia bacterium]